jgi:hypothetical protein
MGSTIRGGLTASTNDSSTSTRPFGAFFYSLCPSKIPAQASALERTQTECRAVEPGAGSGKPGDFTRMSRAWRLSQCQSPAISSNVSNSGRSVSVCFMTGR